jgi:hypothetical protein
MARPRIKALCSRSMSDEERQRFSQIWATIANVATFDDVDLSPAGKPSYNRAMPGKITKAAPLMLTLALAMGANVFATGANAQSWQSPQWQPPWQSQPQPRAPTHRHHREPREAGPEAAIAAPVSTDKRDSLVAAPAPYSGRPYWLALAQCGGIYFKLNALYTDAAVRARVVKPDPKANAELTTKIKEAIGIATAYFDGAEHFLMTDRGIERTDAVLTYEGPARGQGDRVKTVEAGLSEAKSCPALYQACQDAFPKQCGEPLKPAG